MAALAHRTGHSTETNAPLADMNLDAAPKAGQVAIQQSAPDPPALRLEEIEESRREARLSAETNPARLAGIAMAGRRGANPRAAAPAWEDPVAVVAAEVDGANLQFNPFMAVCEY